MKKIFLFSFIFLVSFVFSLGTVDKASAQAVKKVMWGNSEVKAGEIGKVVLQKDVALLNSKTNKTIKTLKKGQEYAVYSKNATQYNLGGGTYVKFSSNVKFQSISKAKLTEYYQVNLPQAIANANSLTQLGNALKLAGWTYVDVKDEDYNRSLTAVRTMYGANFAGVKMLGVGGFHSYSTSISNNTDPILLSINKRFLQLVGVNVGSNYLDTVRQQKGYVQWGNLIFTFGYQTATNWGFYAAEGFDPRY